MRRLGQILKDDFGWPPEAVEHALDLKFQDGSHAPAGDYFRRCTIPGINAQYHVALALLIQRSERTGEQGENFDHVEYRELGELYRFERLANAQRLRKFGYSCRAACVP